MPSSGRHWRRDVIWASVFGVAAIVLPVRSLWIALHLDALRHVTAWQDWLVALALALALGAASGCYARWAVLARERWIWWQNMAAMPRSAPARDANRAASSLDLPLSLSPEWRPLWLRIPLSLVSVAAWLIALASLLAGMYWGFLIIAGLVDPARFVYHPVLREHFMALYLVLLIFPFGLFWFGVVGMACFPRSPKVVADESGMTSVSALGRRHTLRWDDARLLICDGGARSDLGSYAYWSLSGSATTMQWDKDMADFEQRVQLARLIYGRTGLEPCHIKQSFWRRAPLVAQPVRELPAQGGDPEWNSEPV